MSSEFSPNGSWESSANILSTHFVQDLRTEDNSWNGRWRKIIEKWIDSEGHTHVRASKESFSLKEALDQIRL